MTKRQRGEQCTRIRPVASPKSKRVQSKEKGGGGRRGYMLTSSVTVHAYCTAPTSSHLFSLQDLQYNAFCRLEVFSSAYFSES